MEEWPTSNHLKKGEDPNDPNLSLLLSYWLLTEPERAGFIVFSCEPHVEPIGLCSVASNTHTVQVKLGWSENRTNRLEYVRDLWGEDRVERADIDMGGLGSESCQ